MHLLEQNQDKIYWKYLSKNPNALHLLDQNKINWSSLSANESIFELEKKMFYLQIALHPSKIQKYLKDGIEMDNLDNYI